MSKKIINEIVDSQFNEETGMYEVVRKQEIFSIPTEDKYYKFYHEGLMYISDMPAELHKVFYALLDNMTYVNQKVEGLGEYGMHIFLNAAVKRAIAKSLGYSNSRSVDNAVQKLVKGNVLLHIATGIYRPNPYIVAKGAWKEVALLRSECSYPIVKGDTFKQACARKDAVRKSQTEQSTNETQEA